MLNNPYNMSPRNFLRFAEHMPDVVRPQGENFIIFAGPHERHTGLYHSLCRIMWDRDNNPQLLIDHEWHHSESPDKIK